MGNRPFGNKKKQESATNKKEIFILQKPVMRSWVFVMKAGKTYKTNNRQ